MAIHGNTSQVHEYSRKIGNGFVLIRDVDIIQAGETIFHQPSIPPYGVPVGGGEKLPSLDVEKILEDNNLPSEAEKPLAWLLWWVNEKRAQSVVISVTATFVEIGAIGGVNAGFGAITGIIASCIALWQARNYKITQVAVRATVYGTVAWAFGDGNIPLPAAIVESIKKGVTVDKEMELRTYKQTWSQSVSTVIARLDAYCKQEKLDKEEVKLVIRAWSLQYGNSKKPRPERLAAGLLLDAAEKNYKTKFDNSSFLQPWSWYPNDRYVGTPPYPPKISSRYWSLIQ